MGSKKNRREVAAADRGGGNVSQTSFVGEAAAWSKLYTEKLKHKGDDIPRGWRTSREIADMLGKNSGSVNNMFRKWKRTGKIKSRSFRIPIGNRLKAVAHYFCEGSLSL